ncbi:hypothetical protein EQ718_01275 [Paracoccus versutus]|nr:hypothetical protein EQ718_01275 [Paracoccus versutus]
MLTIPARPSRPPRDELAASVFADQADGSSVWDRQLLTDDADLPAFPGSVIAVDRWRFSGLENQHCGGRYATDHKTRLFIRLRNDHPIETTAARAGLSRAMGHRISGPHSCPDARTPPRRAASGSTLASAP